MKIPCLYCGSLILEETARRTGGYCMPHRPTLFLETLGGKIKYGRQLTQKEAEVEFDLEEYQPALRLLFSVMVTGDKLSTFHVELDRKSPRFADRGIVLIRNYVCITGVVFSWSSNPDFYKDYEEPCGIAEVKVAFGSQWQEIEGKLPAGCHFVKFCTSGLSWQCLAGRAGYAIKSGDKVLHSIVTILN